MRKTLENQMEENYLGPRPYELKALCVGIMGVGIGLVGWSLDSPSIQHTGGLIATFSCSYSFFRSSYRTTNNR